MDGRGASTSVIIAVVIAAVVVVGAGVYFIVRQPGGPSGGGQPGGGENQKGPYATFLAIHMEPGSSYPSYQENYWSSVVGLVGLADNYGAKLTLEFAAQWGEYISQDTTKLNLVKQWRQHGHEIALHHHTPKHQGAWDGYTDNTQLIGGKVKNVEYRGSLENMMAWIQLLAAPDNVITACIGPLEEYENVDTEWPLGIKYQTFGVIEGSVSKPVDNLIRGSLVKSVLHQYFYYGQGTVSLEQVKNEFNGAKSDEIVGVVMHQFDYADDPSTMRAWLEFVKGKGYQIRTVRDILSSYPV